MPPILYLHTVNTIGTRNKIARALLYNLPRGKAIVGVNKEENYKMSNEADMRFLLSEISRAKEILAYYESHADEYPQQLIAQRNILKGLLAELESRS